MPAHPSNPRADEAPEDDPAHQGELEREPSAGIPLVWVAVGAVIATVGFFAYVVKDIQDRRASPTAAPGASSAPVGSPPRVPMVVPPHTGSTSPSASSRRP